MARHRNLFAVVDIDVTFARLEYPRPFNLLIQQNLEVFYTFGAVYNTLIEVPDFYAAEFSGFRVVNMNFQV